MGPASLNHYDFIADSYEMLARLYSIGQIRACKHHQIRQLTSKDQVLYAGVGGGEDALLAAKLGARVTVIDLSARMLDRARKRFRAAGLEGEIRILQGDVLTHGPEAAYDVVISNFFLNVFSEPTMREVLGHLVRLTRPGGKLLIADFSPADAGPGVNALRRLYFGAAVRVFRLLARNAIHPLYDYAALFQSAGLRLEGRRDFGPFGLGLFSALVATKWRGKPPQALPHEPGRAGMR